MCSLSSHASALVERRHVPDKSAARWRSLLLVLLVFLARGEWGITNTLIQSARAVWDDASTLDADDIHELLAGMPPLADPLGDICAKLRLTPSLTAPIAASSASLVSAPAEYRCPRGPPPTKESALAEASA